MMLKNKFGSYTKDHKKYGQIPVRSVHEKYIVHIKNELFVATNSVLFISLSSELIYSPILLLSLLLFVDFFRLFKISSAICSAFKTSEMSLNIVFRTA